jgi:hypothetical protein
MVLEVQVQRFYGWLDDVAAHYVHWYVRSCSWKCSLCISIWVAYPEACKSPGFQSSFPFLPARSSYVPVAKMKLCHLCLIIKLWTGVCSWRHPMMEALLSQLRRNRGRSAQQHLPHSFTTSLFQPSRTITSVSIHGICHDMQRLGDLTLCHHASTAASNKTFKA